MLGWDTWRAMDAEAGVPLLRGALTGLAPAADLAATTQLLSQAMNEAALWLSGRPHDLTAAAAVHRSLDRLLTAVTGPGPDAPQRGRERCQRCCR